MTQETIPFVEMQKRVELLTERFAVLSARVKTRVTGAAFKNSSTKEQGQLLVAGGLIASLADPLNKMNEALQPLLPPAEGSGAFAELAIDKAAEKELAKAGIKKEALVLSVAGIHSRLLPILEAIADEAEAKLS